MPQFVLIDPSITALGGHHYEYAVRVLGAAQEAGFTPILATNRKFQTIEPLACRVVPVFRYGFFEPHPPRIAGWLLRKRTLPQRSPAEASSQPPQARSRHPRGLLLRSAASAWYRTVFFRKRRAFANDSVRLFECIRLSDGDIVFLPTLTPAEMLGLLPLFRTNPATAKAGWHLVFRRDVVCGPHGPPHRLRSAFRDFHDGLSGQLVSYYTDTEPLTVDYNRLDVVRFETLPIPAAERERERRREGATERESDGERGGKGPRRGTGPVPHFSPSLSRPVAPSVFHGGPALVMPVHQECLHVVYLGDARLEKGYHWLPRLVEDAVDRGLPVRFTVQSNDSLAPPEPAVTAARQRLAALPPHCGVTLVNNPLSTEAYHHLLHSADIVVLPYDREAYLARSSGVFAEALAAGIPTLVPAGTWMASQLAKAPHLAELVYAETTDLGRHLAQALAHYDRYRRASEAFSIGWSAAHCAAAIVEQLRVATPSQRRPEQLPRWR